MSACLDAALHYAEAYGWPIVAARPNDKAPLTRHGVKDATTDPDLIRFWWARVPNANVAIATGTPGPQVLDVDDLDAARALLARLDAPTVATAKGRHLYYAGQPRGTVVLPFGEVRGTGSYVVAPPSIHPSGTEYVWLAAPNGPLPQLPASVLPEGIGTAGCGDHNPPKGLVPYHQRHPYLRDFAVRLARAGVLDVERVLAHLRLEFELSCELLPPPAPGGLEAIAAWAVRSRIAQRERRT